MKTFLYTLRLNLSFSAAVKRHCFILRVMPGYDALQEISNNAVTVNPSCVLAPCRDSCGNAMLQGFIEQEHAAFAFSSVGQALLKRNPGDVLIAPEPEPWYKCPTRLTFADEALSSLTEGLKAKTPLDYALELSDRLNARFSYVSGSTLTTTTAAEAFAQGKGVCQDYSHILLALLRKEKIACRYVAGLVSGIGSTHAWTEIYTGKGWVAFDPTYNRLCDDTYLSISKGTDFDSCSLEKGIFSGFVSQTIKPYCSLLEVIQ